MPDHSLASARARRPHEDGFTLIELLVVVVILGILIAIAIPTYLNYRQGANDRTAQADLRNAITSLEQCGVDGAYPTAVTSVGVMTGCTTQKIKPSTNTTLRYAPTGTPVVSYVIVSTNSGGTKFYCFDSVDGGSIRDVPGPLATATC
jgi:type IV pilus assembly protein PilA